MSNYRLKWEKNGNDLVLRIPLEMVERLGIVPGDTALARRDSTELPPEFAEDERFKRMQRLLDEDENVLIAFAK